MKQFGLELYSFPEVDGCRHLIVCTDCFTQWSGAKPIRDKTALTVAKFLYELRCCHGCFKVQIDDQGREFVKGVYLLARPYWCRTMYNFSIPFAIKQSCEDTKLNDKECLGKMNEKKWSHIIEGVFLRFAQVDIRQQNTQHFFYSTTETQFYRSTLNSVQREVNVNEVFDEETFQAILVSATCIRGEIHETTTSNIRKTQDKQKKDFGRSYLSNSEIKVGDPILLGNNKIKTEREESFYLHGLVLTWFLKLHSKELQRLKTIR